jgi:cell division transport system permease protein
MGDKLEIRAFIKDGTELADIEILKREVEKIPGVKRIEYIEKELAWMRFKGEYQNTLSFKGVLNFNPLPDSFTIKVNNIEDIETVANYLKNYKLIDDIRYGGDLAERIKKFSDTLRIFGIILVTVLGLATLMIVVNTIRLTVIARQNEITIMQLVGATDSFIKWPFIIEGILIGVFGAIFSLLALKIGYTLFIVKISQAIPFLPMVPENTTINLVYMSVIITGIFLGIFAAYISVSKSLKT